MPGIGVFASLLHICVLRMCACTHYFQLHFAVGLFYS